MSGPYPVRWFLLLCMSLLLVAQLPQCPPVASVPTPTEIGESYRASITVNPVPGATVNRRIFGSNIQWLDRGDQILQPESLQFDYRTLALLFELGPTVLRYPGGSQADVYDWRKGVGRLSDRKENENFFAPGQSQRVLFGTHEFLRLADTLGAEPIITVNLSSGSASEAAEWVRATNVTRFRRDSGELLPAVRFWEIDNEPYLRQDARPELHMPSTEYARRANAAIRAMRAVDPNIELGIPLRSDTIGAIMLPQQTPGFAETVLREISEPFDFVSLHNTYFPFIWQADAKYSDPEVFESLMAASRIVRADMAKTRELLRRHQPGRTIRIAITEYSAMIQIGGPRDAYLSSLGGALYIADLLMLFAQTDDLLMANHWSMLNNWHFGAVSRELPTSSTPERRPAFHVLNAFGDALKGSMLGLTIDAPTFDSRAVGMIPAFDDTPLVSAVGAVEGGLYQLLVINKDPTRPVELDVLSTGRPVSVVRFRQLWTPVLFDSRNARKDVAWKEQPAEVIVLPPHSLGWLEFRLRD